MRKAKFGNKKTVIDGKTFDSKKEANRYVQLKSMLDSGRIKNLRMQVEYVLQPRFENEVTGRTERAIKYVADFVYERDGKIIIEDVKSDITRRHPVYAMKRKMMAFRGWYISEV